MMEGEEMGPTTRRQVSRTQACAALVRGATYAEAGRAGSVSERTVARWMREPDFARSVSDGRAELLCVLSGTLAAAAPDAVRVLLELMTSEVAVERHRAAQQVLTWSSRTRRDGELEQRLLEIETELGLRSAVDDSDDEVER